MAAQAPADPPWPIRNYGGQGICSPTLTRSEIGYFAWSLTLPAHRPHMSATRQHALALVRPAAATPIAQAPTIVLPSSFNTLADPISSLPRRGLGNSSFWPSPALMPSQSSPSPLAPSQSPPVNLPPPARSTTLCVCACVCVCYSQRLASPTKTTLPLPTPTPPPHPLLRPRKDLSSGSHSTAPVNLPQASARRRDAPRPHGRQ